MNKTRIRTQILLDIFPNSIYKHPEVLVFCPLSGGCHATKRKLQINVEHNFWHCWVCDKRGFISTLLWKFANPAQRKKYFSTIDFEIKKEEEEKVEVTLPYGFKYCISNKDSFAYKHLKKIGISDDSIFKNRIGYSDYGYFQDYIIYPSFAEDGILNYYIGRTLDPEKKKYLDCYGVRKKNIIFNDLFINWRKSIVLVESIDTSLLHFSLGNVIPILGSMGIDKRHKIFQKIVMSNIDRIYVALDPDADDKSDKIIKNFLEYGIQPKKVSFPDKPLRLSTEDFVKHIRNSESLSSMDLLEKNILNI